MTGRLFLRDCLFSSLVCIRSTLCFSASLRPSLITFTCVNEVMSPCWLFVRRTLWDIFCSNLLGSGFLFIFLCITIWNGVRK